MYGMYNILSENIENYDHFIVNNSMKEGRQRPSPKMRGSSSTFIKYYLTYPNN